MEQSGRRFKFIDVSRGIAIILMVLGHCIHWDKVYNFIYLFHMALFVFISGFCFRNIIFNNLGDLLDYLKKRIKKLYLFYLKYEVAFFLLTNLLFFVGFYDSTITEGANIYPITSVVQFIKRLARIIIGGGLEPLGTPFWFIISLICITFGYSIIKYISIKQKIINSKIFEKFAVTLCFIIGCLISKYLNIFPVKVSAAFTFMIIFDFGNETYIHRDKLKFNNYIISILCFIALLFLNNFVRIRMIDNEFTNPIAFIICSILGIYLILSVSNLLVSKCKKISDSLQYIGQNTLTIMAYHIICFKIAMTIQFIFTGQNFKYLALLWGYDNKNLWLLLYMVCGLGIPIIINEVKNIFTKRTKLT